eukprot:9136385-Heterocapsa_arctica.AAC.1
MGMKVISRERGHVCAAIKTPQLLIEDHETGKFKPARDSSATLSTGTNTSSPRRNRRANRSKHRPNSTAPPILDSSWLRGNRLRVEAYGILSARMTATGGQLHAGPALDDNTAIVDPAGAHHIRTNQPRTSQAGGVSGAIYKFLAIDKFHQTVVDTLQEPLQAATGIYQRPTSPGWPQDNV